MRHHLASLFMGLVSVLVIAGCPQMNDPGAESGMGDAAQAAPDSSGTEGTSDSSNGADSPSDDSDSGSPDVLDSDFDGVPDAEDPYPFDPFDNDIDADGVGDDVDNCFLYNPDQADADGNGIGDLCEVAILLSGASGPTTILGAALVAFDGQFLGYVNANNFDGNSLANSFGPYGNSFSSVSIWNQFGTYGSRFSALSPWNSFTSTPPILILNGQPIAFVTTSSVLTPAIHPNDLAIAVGRFDVLR